MIITKDADLKGVPRNYHPISSSSVGQNLFREKRLKLVFRGDTLHMEHVCDRKPMALLIIENHFMHEYAR